ncbi:MAG: TRAP transporter substrate-binding protein [Minwuia sp.]|uniref:TRAP transporter substrate-binding protein n=1 Tax=Minwuia sp. TaxID=2493630 RepID=UPI003A88A7D4
MQLGGKPPELVQQATDGVVDIIWTVLGYTPGRFPRAEAFELPFVMTSGEATSRAFQEYADTYMKDDFPGLKVIAVHTHGPGVLHTKAPVNKLEDLGGMKLRGPTRVITGMLDKLGATPVGMPVPAVPEAVSKGVIDGTVIPWEITLPLKMTELVGNHTEFSGKYGFYTATFGFLMNQASYDRLPDDLKAVIDANSGIETAAWAGQAMDGGDTAGRKKAVASGNNIVTLDDAETKRWAEAAAPVIEEWIAEMDGKGMQGGELVDAARALVAKYSN